MNVDTYSSTMEHMGMMSFKIYLINAGNAKCKTWYMCIYTAGLLYTFNSRYVVSINPAAIVV